MASYNLQFVVGSRLKAKSEDIRNKIRSHTQMIRRFLYLLLVPLMLANQTMCIAHSHHGTDVAEPEGHASRPHVHVGGHGHHGSTTDHEHPGGHSHGDHSHRDHSGHDQRSEDDDAALPSVVAPIGDHDADAVYLTKPVTLAQSGQTVTIVSTTSFAASAILRVAHQTDDWLSRLSLLRGQPASVLDAACPIFLRTLSLRI